MNAVDVNALDPLVRAGLEIAALNALFFHRVDREAGVGVAELFVDDGVYIAGSRRAAGRAAIDEAYRARHARGARVSRHVISNHLVVGLDTSGPEPVATATSLLSLYAEDGTAPRPAAAPILVADFHDRLVRGPLGWHYLERRLTPLFLSTAVKPVLPMKEHLEHS
ncbi:nuclear transport factor 2 family protein [Streptomyces hokutonensis]|uniref:Nuclear transport factor 2 family protein n=1 Tax=Streptomyces hokutonensis TaxID=1306990 RepID=A0ABW6M5K7_9ACTN